MKKLDFSRNFLKMKTQLLIITIYILAILFNLLFLCSCDKIDETYDQSSKNLTNGKTKALFNPNVTYGVMTDQDGNIYKTVIIGKQTWMAENLRTTKYNDGTAIPNVTATNEWTNLNNGSYCDYNNTSSIDTISTYGRHYNWFAVETGKLAPKGWHVPSDEEWSILTNYLGGESIAGDKLKEIGIIHWTVLNNGATNESGFTALPAGCRGDFGMFINNGNFGSWWCSTRYNATNAWNRGMSYYNCDVGRYNTNKNIGYSVRCIKD